MDFIHRKVFLNNNLIPYDSDGDGFDDSLIISKTDKIIQVPLTHKFEDIGLYDNYVDNTVTILDIVSVIDENIDQSQIEQPEQPEDIIEINWNSDVDSFSSDDTIITYCTDSNENNTYYATKQENNVTGIVTLTYPYRRDSNDQILVKKYDNRDKQLKFEGTTKPEFCVGDVAEIEVGSVEFAEGNSEFGSFGGNGCNGDCIYYGNRGKYVTDESLEISLNTVQEYFPACDPLFVTNTIEYCFHQDENPPTRTYVNVLTEESRTGPTCIFGKQYLLDELDGAFSGGIDLTAQRSLILDEGCTTVLGCNKARNAANSYCAETYGTITRADGTQETSRVLNDSDFTNTENNTKPWRAVNLMQTDVLYPDVRRNGTYISYGGVEALGICFHCLQSGQ